MSQSVSELRFEPGPPEYEAGLLPLDNAVR
jgi:hypothetical protein